MLAKAPTSHHHGIMMTDRHVKPYLLVPHHHAHVKHSTRVYAYLHGSLQHLTAVQTRDMR